MLGSMFVSSVQEFRVFCIYPWVEIFFFIPSLCYCCDWKLK